MLTDTGSRATSKRKRSKMTAESATEFRDRKRPDVMSAGGGGGKPPAAHLCAGCSTAITDRFLLKAVNKFWHEDCLKCGACDCRLGEVGSTLYEKANLILCRRDYLRLFGSTGHCAACSKLIPAFEMVMRAKDHVYHLECFACQQCNHRFCVGDRFYLCEGKILCEYDYEERRVFASLPYTPGSLDHIKRQVNNLQADSQQQQQQSQHQQQQSQHQQQQQQTQCQQQQQQRARRRAAAGSGAVSPAVHGALTSRPLPPAAAAAAAGAPLADDASSGYGSPDSVTMETR